MVAFTICFFFFKQKTAYEMRISDWSSDVCSSDLTRRLQGFADGDKRAEHDEDGPFHMLISLSHWQCARQHHEGRRAKERHRHRNEPKGCQTHCQRQYGDWQHTLADAPEPERALRQWKRSEEHTSELPSLMRNSYAVFCLTKTTPHNTTNKHKQTTSKLQTQTK